MIESLKKYIMNKIIKSQANFPINNTKTKKFKFLKDLPSYKIFSFGNKNKNLIFYVIKIDGPGGGLFANMLYVLQHLKIAKRFNFIPVVDMENYYGLYNEKNKVFGQSNAWEYYFKQVSNYTLKEVYESKNVILGTGFFSKSMVRSYKEDSDLKEIFLRNVKIKEKFIKNAENFIKKNIHINSTLGVQIRGTNFRTTPLHPMPPSIDQIFYTIDKAMKHQKLKKIFLVTDQQSYLEEFKKKYGSKLCFRDSVRANTGRIFHIIKNKNHRYNLGIDAIEEMLIISKLKFLICSRSNVSEVAIMISKKKINFFEMNNGFNSNRFLYAQFKWHLKKNLPEMLGGFKKKIEPKFIKKK